MILFKYIQNIFILFLLFNTACTNTRVILEGTKKVINKTSKERESKNTNKNFSKGHYKVGNPYEINGIKYIPKLVSEYDETGIASWYGPNLILKRRQMVKYLIKKKYQQLIKRFLCQVL